MSNTYRYQANDQASYNELVDEVIAHDDILCVLDPANKTIIISPNDDESDAISSIGSFIDDRALDFHIDNLDYTNTGLRIAINESESLDDVHQQLKQAQEELDAANKKYESDKWRADYYSRKYDRISEQVRAIGVLVEAITSK